MPVTLPSPRLKILTGAALLAAIAAGLSWQHHDARTSFARSMDTATQENAGTGVPPAPARVKPSPQVEATPPLSLKASSNLAVIGFAGIDVDKVMEQITSHPDDPALLAAAALWSDDPAVWAALHEQSATSALAAATLCSAATGARERLEAAQRLTALEPGNSLATVAAAEASFALGDGETAQDFLSRAVAEPNLDLHAGDYSRGQSANLTTSGFTPVESGMILGGDRWQLKTVQMLSSLSESCLNSRSGEEATPDASRLLTLVARFKKSLGAKATPVATQQLAATEEAVLRRFPPEDVLPGGTTTARERLHALGLERITLSERGSRVTKMLDESSYGVAQDYYRIAADKGETAASEWLLGDRADPPPAGQ